MNQKAKLNLNHALFFFAIIFFLGLTGCNQGGKKHSIRLQEPEIYLTSRQEYVKLTSFQEKLRTNQNLILTAADKLVFAPGDSAKSLRITTSCLISGGAIRSQAIEPQTWNRSFRSEIPFLEMIPFSLIQKELKKEIPGESSITCSFAITAIGDGGSTHRMELPMVAFEIGNLQSDIDLQINLSENVSRSRSSRAQTLADKVQVTFICSGGIADEYVSNSATMTSDRATQILADQQSAQKISWFAAQQKCRIGFLDRERILTAISSELTVQVPRRNVSVAFVHNRDFFYVQSPDTFKLGSFVIRNLSGSPLVLNAPQMPAGMFRYVVLQGDNSSKAVSIGGGIGQQGSYFTNGGSVRLVPRLPIDHVYSNETGMSIDVFLPQGGEATIDVFGINPRIFCELDGRYSEAVFIASVIEQSESALKIHELGSIETSGYTKGALIHNLSISRSAHSVLVNKDFEGGLHVASTMVNPEQIVENSRLPLRPALCLNGARVQQQ